MSIATLANAFPRPDSALEPLPHPPQASSSLSRPHPLHQPSDSSRSINYYSRPHPLKGKKKSLSKEKRVGIEDHIVESNSAISSRHFEEFNSASIIMLKLSILKNRFILICIFFLYVHIIYKFLIIQINVLNVF